MEVFFYRPPGKLDPFPKDGLYRSIRVPPLSENLQRYLLRRRRISYKYKENSGRYLGWLSLRRNPLSITNYIRSYTDRYPYRRPKNNDVLSIRQLPT